MLRVLPTTNQTYLATKQVVAVCGKLLLEVESRTNFCKNICAFYWPKTKFYLIINSSRNFQQTDLLPHLFGWLVFFFPQLLQRNNVNGTEDDLDKRM